MFSNKLNFVLWFLLKILFFVCVLNWTTFSDWISKPILFPNWSTGQWDNYLIENGAVLSRRGGCIQGCIWRRQSGHIAMDFKGTATGDCLIAEISMGLSCNQWQGIHYRNRTKVCVVIMLPFVHNNTDKQGKNYKI